MDLQDIKKAALRSHDTLRTGETLLDDDEIFWLIEQAEELERYKKYVMYFAGKDKVNDIRMAMEDRELD